MNVALRPSVQQIWDWLASVPDPEIPVLSVVDLGIVRDVSWTDTAECLVTITPTYSGCPATEAIGEAIREELTKHGVGPVRLATRIAPAWTTSWMSDEAHRKLREYGIAPPSRGIPISAIGRGGRPMVPVVSCPRCGSDQTREISAFGSTPCKALHRCLDCLEPFDVFKCH